MALAVMTLLTLVAVAEVWYVARLFRRSLSLPLLSFLIYLILWNVLGLFEFEFLYFLRFLPQGARTGFLLFMSINAVLLLGGISYFFMDFLRRWAKRAFPPLLKAGLIAPFAVILVLHSIEAVEDLKTNPSPETFRVAGPWAANLMMLLLFLALADAFLSSGRLPAPKPRRSLRLFAATTAVCLALFGMSIWGALDFGRSWLFHLSLSGFLGLAANIPGIIILREALQRSPSDGALAPSPDDWRRIVERFGLSPREAEIAGLVLSGRSNRDIAAEIYISPETVKKHIANIYQKTGVKSRLQLMNLRLHRE
jgi:DNA-binding CsgD family transcriptional regulator